MVSIRLWFLKKKVFCEGTVIIMLTILKTQLRSKLKVDHIIRQGNLKILWKLLLESVLGCLIIM